jgi:nucleoside-triphosphatase THEP1
MSNCAPASDLARGVACRRPPPWREAAVLGGLWAAVEIAAGSFLHNLRVPFAGMLLASCGVALLVAGDRRWGGRGLIWRAALVCALIKSISPSAVILGPMIGIFTEGLLLEGAVRALGSRRLAYWLGGAFAVLWSFIQKILILLITYGTNIAVLYEEAYRFAARQIGTTGDGAFSLLFWVGAVALTIGTVAAEAGYRIGQAAPRARHADEPAARTALAPLSPGPFPPLAVARVLACIIVVALGFVVIARAPLWGAAAFLAMAAAAIAWSTPAARRRIAHFRMWVELGVLVLASAWLLGALRGNWTEGFLAGSSMVIRAAWVMVGFGWLGATLRRADLAAWLRGGRLAALCDNLDAAVSALPVFATALAERRARWRQPRVLLLELLHVADTVLLGAGPSSSTPRTPPAIVLLTGARGSGKTTLLREVAARARGAHAQVGGILQHVVWQDGERCGYDVEDLATGRTAPLCRLKSAGSPAVRAWEAGPFEFLPRGVALGRRAIRRAGGADLVLIDEVGLLEAAGRGWAPLLDRLVNGRRGSMAWVVRRGLVDAVSARWCDRPPIVVDAATIEVEQMLALLGYVAAPAPGHQPRREPGLPDHAGAHVRPA